MSNSRSNIARVITGGQLLVVSHEFTRPADATAYAANDAIADSTSAPTVGSFAVGRENGASGYIVGISVTHEVVSVTPRIRVRFFNVAPTPINDNAAVAVTYAIVSAASYLGHIDLPAMASDGGTDYSRAQVETSGKLLEYFCASNDNKIYYLTQTLDAFTPGNAKKWMTKIRVDNN